MTLSITIPQKASNADYEAVLRPLHEYNVSRAGNPNIRPVVLLLTDEAGTGVGGLWGQIAYDWLVIELLAVPEKYRGAGFGKTLMDQAEEIAKSDGCIGIWLDTFEFQSCEFYAKLGYETFGILDDHPVGQRRFFLQKRI
ncbi:GNAT family N-acetyltransferase [Sphingopyxis sp. EG6]|uniref:GNAT family N-acetyltransferase n=1 Tax=Sphingopyxis sp. EG6 TaxID=1874061 RepID=UPI000DC63EBA|nr:GNAT family N-acetyltransferase [Sphingopyxis sp. EG6]BBB10619.1 GCN5-like N-acetyltransferase [Sphingopyxis sp. EG6]